MNAWERIQELESDNHTLKQAAQNAIALLAGECPSPRQAEGILRTAVDDTGGVVSFTP